MKQNPEFTLQPHGLISLSCMARPGKYLDLMLEIEEFLKQYVRKLRWVHQNYREGTEQDVVQGDLDFDRYYQHLYKPRFFFVIGNQDLRVDFLVDDFELLLNMPVFANAAKQSFFMNLIPDFMHGFFQDTGQKATSLSRLLQPEQYFAHLSYERSEEELTAANWPIQAQFILRFDLFLKLEFGVRLIRDTCQYLLRTATKAPYEGLTILPMLSLDSNEITVLLFARKKRLISKFVREINVNANLGRVLSKETMEIMKFRLDASIDRKNIKFLRTHPDTTEGFKAFKRRFECADQVMSQLKHEYPEWEDLRSSFDKTKVLNLLKNTKFRRNFFRCLPKTHVLADIFFRLHLANKPVGQKSRQEIHKSAKSFSAWVHTSTFLAVPLECFLDTYYKNSRKLQLAMKRFFFARTFRKSDNFKKLQNSLKTPTENKEALLFKEEESPLVILQKTLFYSSLRTANTEQKRQACHDILRSLPLRVGHISRYAKSIWEAEENKGITRERISAFMNLHLFSFAGKRIPPNEDMGQYKYAYGRTSIRRFIKKVSLQHLIEQVAKENKKWYPVQYATSRTSVYNDFPTNNGFTSFKKRLRRKKIDLAGFTIYEIYDSVISKFKRMTIPKYLFENFLNIIDLYNSYIQDGALFEGFVELAPLIFRIEQVFQELEDEKHGQLLGEYYCSESNTWVKYPITTVRKLEEHLKNFLETFKNAFYKRYFSTRIDHDSLQPPVEYTGTLQVAFSIAQGIQRSLLSFFFRNEPHALLLRANLLTECEDWNVYQRHNLFATASFLSRNHILYPENLEYLKHELGHFIPVSNVLKKTYDETRNPKVKELISALFMKEDPGLLAQCLTPSHSPEMVSRLIHEVIADLFQFQFSCGVNERTNCQEEQFREYVSKVWYQVYVHRLSSYQEPENVPQDELFFPIRKIMICGAIFYQKDLHNMDFMEGIWQEFLHASNPICKYHDRLSQGQLNFSAVYSWIDTNFSTTVTTFLNALFDRMKKYFERDIQLWKNTATYALSPEKIFLHQETREHCNSFLFETTTTLQNLNQSILGKLNNSNQDIYLKYESRTISDSAKNKQQIEYQIAFSPNCGEVAIHPGIGLFSCSLNARKELFQLRTTAIVSLLDISLQSKGELIDSVMRFKRKRHSIMSGKIDKKIEYHQNNDWFYIICSANSAKSYFLVSTTDTMAEEEKHEKVHIYARSDSIQTDGKEENFSPPNWDAMVDTPDEADPHSGYTKGNILFKLPKDVNERVQILLNKEIWDVYSLALANANAQQVEFNPKEWEIISESVYEKYKLLVETDQELEDMFQFVKSSIENGKRNGDQTIIIDPTVPHLARSKNFAVLLKKVTQGS